MHFSKDHEWVRFEGDVATVGISKHAADAATAARYLGDLAGGRAAGAAADDVALGAQGACGHGHLHVRACRGECMKVIHSAMQRYNASRKTGTDDGMHTKKGQPHE